MEGLGSWVRLGPGMGCRAARRSADRTRAPRRANPSLPSERRRRANPSVRLWFAPVRLGAARGRDAGPRDRPRPARRCAERTRRPPTGPEPPRRANPGVGAERTRACKSRSPRRSSVRDGAGVPDLGPRATVLSKTTPYYRESGPARSPDRRRGADSPPRRSDRGREAGPGTGPRPFRSRGLPQSRQRAEGGRDRGRPICSLPSAFLLSGRSQRQKAGGPRDSDQSARRLVRLGWSRIA